MILKLILLIATNVIYLGGSISGCIGLYKTSHNVYYVKLLQYRHY